MAMPQEPDYSDRPWLDPKAEPFIHIESVSKHFGPVQAVRNVDLKIYKGELFALLGGSGCGKSTLLRMLAGFEEPTAGRIVIDGADMTGIPAYDRPTNMMFQSYALFPHMTVERNVGYGLRRDGLPKNEIDTRVAEILEMVELAPLAKRKPHQLSGGQRQRVALARSLVKHPKLLLLDEPLGALDKKLREQTQFELMRIQEQVGITFIVVTHDQEEAMTLSTRIAVMKDGEILQVGTPTEIYEFPDTQYIADFVGSVNLFEGRVAEDEPDHLIVKSPESGCDIYIDHGESLRVGTTVWVAVRPEKVTLSTEAPADSKFNTFRGRVLEFAYMGNYSNFRVEAESGKVVRVMQQNVERRADASHRIDWDDEVYISWAPGSAVVLTE